MRVRDASEMLNNIYGKLYQMTFADLEDMIQEINIYGLDLEITNDMITAWENETLQEYMETQIWLKSS